VKITTTDLRLGGLVSLDTLKHGSDHLESAGTLDQSGLGNSGIAQSLVAHIAENT